MKTFCLRNFKLFLIFSYILFSHFKGNIQKSLTALFFFLHLELDFKTILNLG